MSPTRLGPSGAPLTLEAVAAMVGGRLVAPPGTQVSGVAPLDEAGPAQIAFFASKRWAKHLAASRAGAYLVSEELERELQPRAPRVIVGSPHDALRLIVEHFHPREREPADVHATAVLGRGVRLGKGVRVEPYAVLGEDVTIGDGTHVGAHCVLGARTEVGTSCTLHAHVVTYADTVIGSHVVLHAGVRVGSDGFGYTRMQGYPEKMPQVGRAVIEDGVEVGANTTIDRGSLGDTVVGRGTKIDNLVQIAHNVRVGAGSMIAALVGIAGSTRIGPGAWFGGRSCAANHLEIGEGARVTFGATVLRDVPAGETVSGYPSRPHRDQLRAQALSNRLPGLVERMERLEASVTTLRGSGDAAGSPGIG